MHKNHKKNYTTLEVEEHAPSYTLCRKEDEQPKELLVLKFIIKHYEVVFFYCKIKMFTSFEFLLLWLMQ